MSAIIANRVYGHIIMVKSIDLFKELNKLIPFVMIPLSKGYAQDFCRKNESHIPCTKINKVNNSIDCLKDVMYTLDIDYDMIITKNLYNKTITINYDNGLYVYLIKRVSD